MQLKKSVSIVGLLLSLTALAYAQRVPAPTYQSEEPPAKGFDPSRLVFGGNLGASFGNFTFVNVSPQVGYRLKPNFIAGAGINFIYQQATFFNNDKESIGYAGLNVFARYLPVQFIMLNAQPELNYSWGKYNFREPNIPDEKLEGKLVPSLLLGGGLVLGRGFMISAQYDVIQNERSPYGRNVFLGFGFMF